MERNAVAPASADRPVRSLCVLLQSAALCTLLVVIGFRPLVQETYESSQPLLGHLLDAGGGASPGLTAILDGLVVLAAMLWAISVTVGGFVRREKTGLWMPVALLVAAGVVSLFAASDKRVAINATFDWMLLPLLAFLLLRLLQRPWQIRLTLCVLLASATTSAVECFYQKFVSFPDTIEVYENGLRDKIWAEQGLEPDDPQVILFERRLYGAESRGFFAHNNIAGSYLMLCMFAAGGLGYSRLRSDPLPFRKGFGVCVLGLAGMMAAAVILTGSRGAILSGLVGFGLLKMALWASDLLKKHRRRVLLVGWSLVGGGAIAVLVYGITYDSLPGKSLAYRWAYWKAAAAITADHSWTGVGLGNFGKYYPRYKGIESPEEVRDPHNMLATATVSWGVLGGVGLLWLLIAASRAVTRTAAPVDRHEKTTDEAGQSPHALGRLLLISVGVFALRLTVLDRTQPAYLIETLLLPFLVWSFAFVLISLDTNVLGQWANDPLREIRPALGCGLIAFLLHNTITFSLFEPGPATTAFTLFAVLLACGGGAKTACTSAPVTLSRLRGCAGSVVLAAAWLGLLLPTVRANGELKTAWNLLHVGRPRQALAAFDRAGKIDFRDPTPLREAADLLASMVAGQENKDRSAELLTASLTYLKQATERDPEEIGIVRRLVRVRTELFLRTGEPSHAEQAILAAEKAVEMYPSLPSGYEQLGDVHAAIAEVTADPGTIAAAIRAYDQALRLDEQRPADEVRRYPARRRAAIREKIDSLRRLGAASVR